MPKCILYLVPTLAAAVFAPVEAAQAGLIIVQKRVNPYAHDVRQQTFYLEGHRLAVVSDDGTGQIFDADKNTRWTYDTRNKHYMRISADEDRTMLSEARAASNEFLRKKMKNMPPQARKRLLGHMAAAKKGPTYKVLGKRKKVGRWSCSTVGKYMPFSDKPVETLCIASFSDVGIGAGEVRTIAAITEQTPMYGGNEAAALKKIGMDGWSVENDNRYAGVTTVVSVRHGEIPAEVFDVPAGLRERKPLRFYTK